MNRMNSLFERAAVAALLIVVGHAAVSAATVPANATSSEDVLPRRAFLGLTVVAAPNKQVRIGKIFPGSSAASSGFEVGDLLLDVEGTAIDSVPGFPAVMRPFRPGEQIVSRVQRGDNQLSITTTLREFPRERAEGLEVLYDAVRAPNAVLRSILTKPRGSEGRLPAVLFMQGIDCSTVERLPSGEPGVIGDLVYGLTRAGFVVMRTERSGVGDSTGTPCRDIGFQDEVAGYLGALRKLKSYEFVDPQRVFLFGHSAGGWVAPLVASSESVRGIAVYGTVVRPYAEYLVENYRRNRRLRDHADPVQLEENLRQMTQFLHYLVAENKSAREIIALHPELAGARKILFPSDDEHFYDLRSLRYLRELSNVKLAQAWTQSDVPVLALYGEYDIRTTAMDHEYIAEIVNAKHPGHGGWAQIPQMDHGFALHPSLREAVGQEFKGPFGEKVVLESANWMQGLR
jgi:pimeloyl-ACP methyl ester carboxylesterase